MKNKLVLILQALVTMGLLAWVFGNPEVRSNTAGVLRNADPGWLLGAVAIAGLENLLGVFRWSIFLELLGIREKFWTILRLQLLGVFFNTFLVGMVGGDAVKALVLIGRGHSRGAALLSVALDRLSGLGGLLLASSIFIPWHYQWLVRSPFVEKTVHFVFLYFAAAIGLTALSFFAVSTGAADSLPRWIPSHEKVARFCKSYSLFFKKWRQTLLASGLSFFMLLGYFSVYACSMRAFGVRMRWDEVFAFMPAVDVIAAMPVSLGGIGVREKLFVHLLGDLAGVPAATAVWISIAGFLASLFWGTVGLLALPFFKGFLERARAGEEEGAGA